jgi:hypothetical protein
MIAIQSVVLLARVPFYTGIYYFHLQNKSPCPEDGDNRFLQNVDTRLVN